MKKILPTFLALAGGVTLFVFTGLSNTTATENTSLKALLILGGCCHDYAVQKELIKAGLESRLNIEVDIEYNPDTST
ncbi:MAG: hypothetical protein HRU46_05050, partial [Verrucomicrobiales bacterium]|nr:hypothetical protein [Verrucomicrobiales bacterium]